MKLRLWLYSSLSSTGFISFLDDTHCLYILLTFFSFCFLYLFAFNFFSKKLIICMSSSWRYVSSANLYGHRRISKIFASFIMKIRSTELCSATFSVNLAKSEIHLLCALSYYSFHGSPFVFWLISLFRSIGSLHLVSGWSGYLQFKLMWTSYKIYCVNTLW